MTIRFVKLSVRRLLWSTSVVALGSCVTARVVLYSFEIATHSDLQPTPKGDYVRLFVMDIAFWGPALLFAIWQVTIPLILGFGVFAACVRRVPAAGEDGGP